MPIATVVWGLLTAGLLITPAAARQDDGETEFGESTCARCHSVEARETEATVAERMQGPDLSTIGAKHDAAWIVAYIKQEETLDGEAHRARFRGEDDELAAIAAWLESLQ